MNSILRDIHAQPKRQLVLNPHRGVFVCAEKNAFYGVLCDWPFFSLMCHALSETFVLEESGRRNIRKSFGFKARVVARIFVQAPVKPTGPNSRPPSSLVSPERVVWCRGESRLFFPYRAPIVGTKIQRACELEGLFQHRLLPRQN